MNISLTKFFYLLFLMLVLSGCSTDRELGDQFYEEKNFSEAASHYRKSYNSFRNKKEEIDEKFRVNFARSMFYEANGDPQQIDEKFILEIYKLNDDYIVHDDIDNIIIGICLLYTNQAENARKWLLKSTHIKAKKDISDIINSKDFVISLAKSGLHDYAAFYAAKYKLEETLDVAKTLAFAYLEIKNFIKAREHLQKIYDGQQFNSQDIEDTLKALIYAKIPLLQKYQLVEIFQTKIKKPAVYNILGMLSEILSNNPHDQDAIKLIIKPAKYWYKLAYQEGNSNGLYNLATLELGNSINKDSDGYKLLQKSAKENNASAETYLLYLDYGIKDIEKFIVSANILHKDYSLNKLTPTGQRLAARKFAALAKAHLAEFFENKDYQKHKPTKLISLIDQRFVPSLILYDFTFRLMPSDIKDELFSIEEQAKIKNLYKISRSRNTWYPYSYKYTKYS